MVHVTINYRKQNSLTLYTTEMFPNCQRHNPTQHKFYLRELKIFHQNKKISNLHLWCLTNRQTGKFGMLRKTFTWQPQIFIHWRRVSLLKNTEYTAYFSQTAATVNITHDTTCQYVYSGKVVKFEQKNNSKVIIVLDTTSHTTQARQPFFRSWHT
jgi:hypothetical protein